MKNLTRRQIRYICFRLRSAANGGPQIEQEETGVMSYVDQVKEHMESQKDFGGWNKFGKTWDVDEKAHFVVVLRLKSIDSEWDTVIEENAIDFPEIAMQKEREGQD